MKGPFFEIAMLLLVSAFAGALIVRLRPPGLNACMVVGTGRLRGTPLPRGRGDGERRRRPAAGPIVFGVGRHCGRPSRKLRHAVVQGRNHAASSLAEDIRRGALPGVSPDPTASQERPA